MLVLSEGDDHHSTPSFVLWEDCHLDIHHQPHHYIADVVVIIIITLNLR